MTRSADAQQLSLGDLARSHKENERRLPIHPAHFSRIDRRVRPRIFIERGYGSDFGAHLKLVERGPLQLIDTS
jgi:hypothetical protein